MPFLIASDLDRLNRDRLREEIESEVIEANDEIKSRNTDILDRDSAVLPIRGIGEKVVLVIFIEPVNESFILSLGGFSEVLALE